MAGNYKTSYRVYSAWNYMKEVEDLNRASEQGWQLVKGGCFHSRFVKNPNVRYRYQLDYRKVDDMARYIETFREQGWEYISSTFNGWHYFRKLYDPSLPEDAYEIFTDRESLSEMNGRWARFALGIGIAIGLFAVLSGIRLIMQPELLRVVHLVLFSVESALLIRGALIMRNPDASRNRKGDGALLITFFAVILLGVAAMIGLGEARPHWYTEQRADAIDAPITDNRWMGFDVRYRDFYYLDIDMSADEPMTFGLVNEDGDIVFTVTDTEFHENDIRLKLPKGHYDYTMSATTGFEITVEID